MLELFGAKCNKNIMHLAGWRHKLDLCMYFWNKIKLCIKKMVDGLPTVALLAENKVLNVQRQQGKRNGLEAKQFIASDD